MPTNLDSELEKILPEDRFNPWFEGSEYGQDELYEAKEAIKQLFLKTIEEIVGKEDKEQWVVQGKYTGQDVVKKSPKARIRNQLRQEIKQRAGEILNE